MSMPITLLEIGVAHITTGSRDALVVGVNTTLGGVLRLTEEGWGDFFEAGFMPDSFTTGAAYYVDGESLSYLTDFLNEEPQYPKNGFLYALRDTIQVVLNSNEPCAIMVTELWGAKE